MLDELVLKIQENCELGREEISRLITEKEREFSGLISAEGAAHIVAKELGINLLEKMTKTIKVGSITTTMPSVNAVAKVVRVTEPRTFKKSDGTQGTVVNVTLADETGSIRLSLWDDQTRIVTEGNIKIGDVIEIVNGFTKEDNRGSPELRVGKRGIIKKSDETVTVAERAEAGRTEIGKLKVGDSAELRAAVVQVFESNPFYFVCPQCERRVPENKCEEHGEVTPKPSMILSGVVDDGTGNVRAVFFRDAAERLSGLTTMEAFKKSGSGLNPKPLFDLLQSRLGAELLLKGYVKQNKFFERHEFIVNGVEDVNPAEEAKKLVAALAAKPATVALPQIAA